MIELEYNGERYMVDGGQWYRRLKERGIRPDGYQTMWKDHIYSERVWVSGEIKGGYIGEGDWENLHYRVPCTDPRPPFVVGQRVKVVRGPAVSQYGDRIAVVHSLCDNGSIDLEFDTPGYIATPWCLDPVEPTPEDEEGYKHVPLKKVGTIVGKFVPCDGDQPDTDPELDHILRKLKSLTDRAAEVRRIKRECYQKLAALLPEEMR